MFSRKWKLLFYSSFKCKLEKVSYLTGTISLYFPCCSKVLKALSSSVFWLRGGKGATVFSHPDSGFIRHQPTPPCRLSLIPIKPKFIPEVSQWQTWCYVCPGLPYSLSPNKVGDDITMATSDWKGLSITVKLTTHNRQAQIEVLSSATTLIIKALKESPKDRKTLSTMEISLLMRLSTLSKRCSSNL